MENPKALDLFSGCGGLIDKDLTKFSQRQLLMDYDTWQKQFLDKKNT